MKARLRWLILMLVSGTWVPLQGVRSFFNPRSQSVDAARDLVGWQEYINRFSTNCCYGALALIPEYTSSFNSAKLAEYYFGSNNLVVSGSSVVLRGPRDLLADYFGLPTDFCSTLLFAPVVKNAMLDMAWYLGLDAFMRGTYLRVQAPLVYTHWNLNLCELLRNPGTNGYPAGYMASTALERPFLAQTVKQFLTGSVGVGDIQPLRFGRVWGAQSTTQLSEVQVVFGYNPVLGGGHHFGWNVRLSLPTGTHSQADYIFEPVVGNGGHWEAGVGFTGHGIFWENEEKSAHFGLYGDINITHLFKAGQRRSFDLEMNGPASRYLLLEEIANPTVDALTLMTSSSPAVYVPAQQQYHGKLLPAINVTTLHVNTSVAVQIDMAIKASFRYKRYTFDIGYNGWYHSGETLCDRECFPANSYAVKGDALVYGFTDGLDAVRAKFVALNATQHRATVHAGQGGGNATLTNANADHAALSFFEGNPLYESSHTNQVSGSAQAILLKDCNINDLSGLAPRATSYKLFFHISYDSEKQEGLVPYVGLGTFVEVDNTTKRERSALSQWGVWLKMGVYH